MWHIQNPEIRKSTLDFTSSGQERLEVSQLVFENTVLMNAVELIKFNNDSVQVIICDHCGYVGCQSGNWVCFRKSGDFVLLVPDFKRIEQDDWSATQYGFPYFYDKSTHKRQNGTPYFDLETYKNLRKAFPQFPVFGQIKNLKMSEAVRLAQLNMPYRFFGEPPEISVTLDKSKLIVGASKAEEHLQKIEEILRENYENDFPAQIRKILPTEKIIYLFLDADEFVDWQALVKNNESFLLTLEENFVITPND